LATLEKISVRKTSIDVMKNGLSGLVLRIAEAAHESRFRPVLGRSDHPEKVMSGRSRREGIRIIRYAGRANYHRRPGPAKA